MYASEETPELAFSAPRPVPRSVTSLAIGSDPYQTLVKKAYTERWTQVYPLLQNPECRREPQQQKVVEAISRLAQHAPKTLSLFSEEQQQCDWQTVNSAYFRLTQSKQSAKNHEQDIAQRVEDYLNTSRVLKYFGGTFEAQDSLEKALRVQIQSLGNTWPGKENLARQEQFFWNLCTQTYDISDLLFKIFSTPHLPEWQQFVEFCDFHLVGRDNFFKGPCMAKLFPAFQAFPNKNTFFQFCEYVLERTDDFTKASFIANMLPIHQAFLQQEEQKKAFLRFCKHFLRGELDIFTKVSCMTKLLPIFQAYPDTGTQRDIFLQFCEPYLDGLALIEQISSMTKLLPIFQAFSNTTQLNIFLQFCPPHLVGVPPTEQPTCIEYLLSVFHAFSNTIQLSTFFQFCEPYLAEITPKEKPYRMRRLLPIFQAFSDTAQLNAFLHFCTYLLSRTALTEKPYRMTQLLPAYQHYRVGFQSFLQQHIAYGRTDIFDSYVPRTYLRYMRSIAALQAETTHLPHHPCVQAMYETDQFNQLPILWGGDDPFLAYARDTTHTANAHDFESVYEQDYATLVGWCAEHGYRDALSTIDHSLYNNDEITVNYHTTCEVENFITYLDTTVATGTHLKLDSKNIASSRVVSLVKQMLGLEEKTGSTTSEFAPYLGYSMFYAKSKSSKGDQVLGRVWYMMKKIGEDKHGRDPKEDPEVYKKSIVLAILEAAELSEGKTDIHCQTRITGELMKAIAWNLPDSKLRPLIAADDLPPATTDTDMITRIAFAPDRAKQIFKRIYSIPKEGGLYSLWKRHLEQATTPELWEFYQAYYDDLYRRTKNPDGGYRLDDNTLTRDDHGNLVRAHLADGTPRPPAEVEIVYHQAEFQVLELAFTELMRKEFEEQRGLKY